MKTKDIEIAIKINKYIHEQCINGVPHDIGWNIMKMFVSESTLPNEVSPSDKEILNIIYRNLSSSGEVDYDIVNDLQALFKNDAVKGCSDTRIDFIKK